MGNVFSGSEIVEIGIQIEKNGRDFYAGMLASSGDKSCRKVFDYLMRAEENHIKTFSKILSTVGKHESPESYEGEYFSYMKALAQEHIFTKKNAGRDAAAKMESDMEAIETAMGFEQDSIKFYEGMKKVVPERDHELLYALIREEQEHYRELGELKQVIGKGG